MKATGGARVGWVNATWPLATLAASADELALSLTLLGRYRFAPDEVVALEPHGSLPLLGRGVRIVHVRSDYPETILFWCAGSSEALIQQIQSVGFLGTASSAQLPERAGNPLRWSFVLACVAVWNLLLLPEVLGTGNDTGERGGPLTLLAVAFAFVTSVALERSNRLQLLALKPGRSIDEVRPITRLLQLVSGLMLVGFLFVRAAD